MGLSTKQTIVLIGGMIVTWLWTFVLLYLIENFGKEYFVVASITPYVLILIYVLVREKNFIEKGVVEDNG